MIWTWDFWRAAIERAIKTAAQTAIATIGSTAAIHQVEWWLVGSVAAMATVLSLLMSVASSAITGKGPSLTDAEVLAPDARRAVEG